MKSKTDQPPLAYEPNYTTHGEAERRRKEVQEWLKRRDWDPDAAPIAQDSHNPLQRQRSRLHPIRGNDLFATKLRLHNRDYALSNGSIRREVLPGGNRGRDGRATYGAHPSQPGEACLQS